MYKRVVVTGGAGFIGSNYVRYAIQQHPHWQVVVLDKLTYAGNLDNLSGLPIEWIEGDIANPHTVQQALQGADAVLNFAAESHVDRSLLNPQGFVRSNIEGVMVLLQAVKELQIQRFLQVSTDEVYGDLPPQAPSSRESDPLAPRSPYSASKAAAEHLVYSYHISYGLNTVITRGSNTYGPYQYPEKIIPLFITNALLDLPLPVYGNGLAVRDYMHVSDHVAGIDRVLHQGVSGGVYNLGTQHGINGVQVAQAVLRALGKPPELMQFVKDRPGHDYRYSVNSKQAHQLGWQPQVDFEQGLKQTAQWYAQNHGWWQKLRQQEAYRQHQQTWYSERS